ncbi:ferritin-like domain-containing protein [Dactylosporangium sp. CA-092794]|uniref:YciE/YciF ferroxidase family protein n=1 Tax=Dactylosporangium sp. CA-092794 TaxID=3239929 RepID=UPI003D94CB35
MAIDNPADLFLYELSGMYDAERKSNQLVGEILGQAEQSPLAQILRAQQQQGQQKIQNIETCFAMMEMEPDDVPCMALDGMRAEFQAFTEQRPSMEAMEIYTVDAETKLAHFGMAAYQSLIDKALLMGEMQCAQVLRTNLVQKQENAGTFERISHELGQRVVMSV